MATEPYWLENKWQSFNFTCIYSWKVLIFLRFSINFYNFLEIFGKWLPFLANIRQNLIFLNISQFCFGILMFFSSLKIFSVLSFIEGGARFRWQRVHFWLARWARNPRKLRLPLKSLPQCWHFLWVLKWALAFGTLSYNWRESKHV